MKGYFITFEGGDGAGKTTLIKEIHRALVKKGHDIFETRAPGGTNIGKTLREIILHSKEPIDKKTELFLYLADRSEHIEKVILPALELGKTILCDRYNDSTIAYQGVGRNLGIDFVKNLTEFATNKLKPTLTLYLDVDPELGLARTNTSKDLIESEGISFHEKIRKAFHKLADQEPDRIYIIDANASKETVLKKALHLIDEHCNQTTT